MLIFLTAFIGFGLGLAVVLVGLLTADLFFDCGPAMRDPDPQDNRIPIGPTDI